MDLGLKGRTVLVTGASRNMGKEVALAFAREGAKLAICTSSKLDELNGVAAELRALGAKVVAERCDVTVEADVQAFVAKAAGELGSVDVVVNTAGYRGESMLQELSVEEWNRCFAVNLTGPMLICRSAIPLMVERRWGRIINISGMAGFIGTYPAQAMVKLGIVGFTRSLARQYGAYNITANCLSPGGGVPGGGGIRPEVQAAGPARPAPVIGRKGQRAEFVACIVYLASEQAAFMTGQLAHMNGGSYFQ